MSVSLKGYLDAALTTPVTAVGPAELAQILGGGTVDRQLWLGSTATDRIFRAASDPGADPIMIEIDDVDAGTGQPASSLRLALTQAGLASATAGEALAVGTEIESGVANAVPFWVRWTPAGETVGVYLDLALQTSVVIEEVV
ncbi:hypothetical protein [Pseudothauera rhizosphaerae]|uniref:Uncharacterized protein n=1 Tax=Pseudothauera rhizosphaerae TaxID=2565932 RepID=A0A4S4AMS3_9RHOO|nr:hypothetical protein [Pseudothauera rhizosphaerae]THF60900.1 hypothetical protein E6O51_11760 [Pseudothauera rhizosphaerae]